VTMCHATSMLAFALGLSLASVASAAAPPPKADFYVATSGEDTDAGTEAKPFATLARARDAVREKIAKGLDAPVTVLVRGGTYELAEPLAFGPEDSGTDKCPVTYAACPGEKVVLSGGRPIRGWKKRDGNRWVADLPDVKAGTWRFRELFAAGKRLPRARFPNKGLLHLKEVSQGVKVLGLDQAIPGGDLAGKDAEIVVVENWSLSRAAIASSTDRSVTTPTAVGWIGHGPMTTASPGKPAWLEHAPAFLDEPGEWYLDRAAGELRYMAAADEDPAKAAWIAPRLERLLVVMGRPGAPVRYLRFQGIEFLYTTWRFPDGGYSGIQAGHYGPDLKRPVYLLPAALEFGFAENCRLERCRVAHTGAGGIALGAGCRTSAIVGCEITDVGGDGIVVGARGNRLGDLSMPALDGDWPNPQDAPCAIEVSNCYLHNCGAANAGCVGLFVAFTANTVVRHNVVTDMPYTGISVGFRWNTTPTSQKECLVEFNHISDVMKMLADGGGIYTLGLQPGTVLRGNWIHDIHRSSFAHGGAPNNGIFFDEGSKGFLVERNLIYDAHGGPIRFNQCQEGWHTWRNNTLGKEPAAEATKDLGAGLEPPFASLLTGEP